MNLFGHEPINLANPVARDHPLNRSRIAWYLAIEGLSGGKTFQDLMGKSPGTLTNTGTDGGWRGSTRPGGFGHLLFDGTDDYVACGKPNGTAGLSTGYTISGWVYYASLGAGSQWIANDDASGSIYQYSMYVPASGAYQVYIGTVPDYCVFGSAAGVIVAGRWHHIVVTNNGTCDVASTKLYLNGIEISLTRTPSGTPVVPTSGFGNTAIGRAGDYNSDYLNGRVDDVGIWTRVLSAAEARALYDLSQCGYPGMLSRINRAVTLLVTTPTPGPPPIPPDPYGVSGASISQISTVAQQLAARTHRLSAHAENPIELWYLRDDTWRLFPVQPLSGPDIGLELTQVYKQPATLGFTLPDNDGLYEAENRNSTYNYNAANVFDPLLDEARKILLRVGTKCYTNLAGGRTPTASQAISLGMLVNLTDSALVDWTGTGRVPFGSGAAFAFSGTAPTLDITVDLGASYFIRHTVIRFGTRIDGFTLPASVATQISSDNVTYKSWPIRPVGGPIGDWAEDYDGREAEIPVCDINTAARYVRFHIVGIDGSTSIGIDELAVYGGYQFANLGANLFTGYLGDQIDFTPEGTVTCVAVDVLKKLADNNDVYLTAPYRMTSAGGIELADIAYSLLTSTAYWKDITANGYDAPLTEDDIGWGNGEGLTGLRYPLWQGQTNSILGYCLELFHTIGWDFWADGNGILQATDPPTTQKLPDRVCISALDGNYDVWGNKRHRTGKQLRNNVIVQTGKASATSGSASINLFDPNSIAKYGTRTTRITDPLANTTPLRLRVAEYFLRDYAWNLQTLTNSIRPQFETRMKQIFGFRAPARPNLYSKASSVTGNLRAQELWSLVGLRHNITYGQWTADAEWVPYVAQLLAAPNFTDLNAVGGNPTWLTFVYDAITNPLIVSVHIYTSTTSAFTGYSLQANDFSLDTGIVTLAGFTADVPVWAYLAAVDAEGNEGTPSIVLSATPGNLSQSQTCYTIDDFTVSSILTEGPDAQGYYTYQFLGLWTAPECGFTQSDVRAYVEPVPGAGPPSDPTNPNSWPLNEDSWDWWAPDRILENLTWDNVTPGDLNFVFTFRSASALAGKRIYWRIWNSARTRAWRPIVGNYTSCVVASP